MRTPFHPSEDDMRVESLLFALSDPTRLNIVAELDVCYEKTCGALDVSVSKATAAQHFRVLREAGIVRTRVQGKHRFLSLRREEMDRRFPGLLRAVLNGRLAKVRG